MDKKIFECETVTPLFLGGADGTTAELRPPSIKGMMRFWWRALHGDLSIPCLKEKEGKIFGSSDEKIGRSKFNIRVNPHNLETSDETFSNNKLKYLSFGTHDPKHNYIKAGQKFSIIITSHYPIHNDIEKSLKIMSTFGGLGSKSRNGFGSFKILKIDDKSGDFYYNLKKNNFTPDLPKYSAFSQNMRLWRIKNSEGSQNETLKKLGKVYKEGKNELKKAEFDMREYIGAPITFKNDNKDKESKLKRHSKPYFMSVHHENDSFIGYILYLPSEYAYEIKQSDLNYDEEKFDNEKETENFTKACKKLNDYFENDNNLEEVPL
jgi:CRISPR-associated protein Cmr1